MVKSRLQKFSSFKKARDEAMSEHIVHEFDLKSAKAFFSGYSGGPQTLYTPGLYRFKSFKAAREYDMKALIRASSGGR